MTPLASILLKTTLDIYVIRISLFLTLMEKKHFFLKTYFIVFIVFLLGVFGAGKSYLLAVVVLLLVKLFEINASYSPGVPFPWKILISSTTNVAVDRILLG